MPFHGSTGRYVMKELVEVIAKSLVEASGRSDCH